MTTNNPSMSPEEIDRLARKRAGAKLGWYFHAAVYVVVNLFVFAMSQYGFGNRSWSVYPLLGWGLGLALHGAVGLADWGRWRVAGAHGAKGTRTPAARPGPAQRLMKIDWLVKLRHFLQTMAFCLAIAALHLAFQPERSYDVPLVYSLSIGLTSWLLIDFGRLLFASAWESGWPTGIWGKLLPLTGIALGYVIGTSIADWWFGWSSWAGASRQQLFLSVLVSVVIGIIITYYFYSARKGEYLERKVGEATRQATEARLKLLETQLEPHMLFNTLANLRVLIGIGPAARARHAGPHDGLPARHAERLARQQPPAGARVRPAARLPGADGRSHGPAPALRAGPATRPGRPEACRRCCCSRWWKTASSTGWSPRWKAAPSPCARCAMASALTLEVSDTGVGFDSAGSSAKRLWPCAGARTSGHRL